MRAIILTGVVLLVFTLSLAVQLVINTIPGVSVYVNGKLILQTDDPKIVLDLEPGFYEITVRKPGYSEESKRINLNESTQIDLIPKAFGELDITTTPIARVYINNTLYGISPVKIKLPEGKYEIKIELDGYLTVEKQIIIKPFELVELHQSLIKFGTVMIESQPEKSKVFLNSDFLGTTPLSTSLTPGKYLFKFEKEGYLSKELEVSVSKEPQKIFVELEPSASLSIYGTPAAQVMIDGVFAGFSPINIKDLSTGKHSITLEATGFEVLKDEISLKKGENSYNYSLKKKSFSLTLESSPTGAMVFVDEKFAGFTPLSTELLYGVHTVRMKKDNLEYFKEFIITKSEKIFVEIEKVSSLILESIQKDTFVELEGKLVKLPAVINLPEGAYKISFVNPSFSNRIRYIFLEGGKIIKFAVDMRGEGYLNVVTLPQNAEVYWLNEKIGNTPLFMKKVPAGKGILRLVKDDVEENLDIEINDGEYKSIFETLDRMINVHFLSVPEKCNVYVNGIFIGETPLNFALKPDIYEVIYKKNGFISQKMVMDLRFDIEDRYLNVFLEKVE